MSGNTSDRRLRREVSLGAATTVRPEPGSSRLSSRLSTATSLASTLLSPRKLW